MTGHAVPVPETPEVPVVPPPETRPPKVRTRPTSSLLDPSILRRAALEAFVKLDPRTMIGNPVMFVVEIGSVITTVEFFARPDVFVGLVTLWLWATVLFANFAEAVAEGRGKAQADTLRRSRRETVAQLLRPDGTTQEIPAAQLRAGDLTVVTAGQVIPGDGDVVEGMAVVDESAITGESAPVIRESGGDRSAVTGGTIVLSDRIVVQVTSNPGRDVPGSHDRPSRGGEPAEDAERGGARHPHRRLDAHPPRRGGNPAADGHLRPGHPVHRGPDRAVRLPGPDHDRRPAVGDRHRRHGPDGTAERAGHVRTGGGGGRGLLDAAARQDRHDHLREPDGRRVHPRRGRHRTRAGRGRATCPAWPTRPPRAAPSSTSPNPVTRSCRRRWRTPGSSRSRPRPG